QQMSLCQGQLKSANIGSDIRKHASRENLGGISLSIANDFAIDSGSTLNCMLVLLQYTDPSSLCDQQPICTYIKGVVGVGIGPPVEGRERIKNFQGAWM